MIEREMGYCAAKSLSSCEMFLFSVDRIAEIRFIPHVLSLFKLY
jgi:hypothetical protein